MLIEVQKKKKVKQQEKNTWKLMAENTDLQTRNVSELQGEQT